MTNCAASANIARILCVDLAQVCEQLEELEPGCSQAGCTPDLLLDYAKQNNYGLVCLHNNRPTLSQQGAPILAFCIVDCHAYFYKNQAVARKVLQWRDTGGERLKRKFRHTKAWVRPQELNTLEGAAQRGCLEGAP